MFGFKRLSVLLISLFCILSVSASEPASLYARITLTPEQYQAFLQSPPGTAASFNDWQSWFDSKQMYGGGKVNRGELSVAAWPSMEAYLNSMDVHEYDPKTQVLKIGLLLLSENYSDVLIGIYPLRWIAEFRQQDNPLASDDFIIVYPFIWGDDQNSKADVMAYLQFKGNQSEFVNPVTDESLKEASGFLAPILEKLSREGED